MTFADSSIESRVLALLNADKKITLNSWQVETLVTTAVSLLLVSVALLDHGSEWVIAFVTGLY